jgi:CheY-like chemotaxis protein
MEDANQGLNPPVTPPDEIPVRSVPLARILVVEDDLFVLRVNTETLVRAGYEVDAAEDGAQAWDAIEANDYDLVVTDNSMPKLTGVELLKKLRSERMLLPVIMATGTIPAEEFAASPWLRPEVTLLKPHTSQDLLKAVQGLLPAP